MQYLEINNDLYTSGIKNEFGDYLTQDSSGLPGWVFESLEGYHDFIESVTSAGKYKLRANYRRCYEVDLNGYKVKERLESTDNFKVKYFSRFLNKFLYREPELSDYPKPTLVDKLRNFFDSLLTRSH